MLFLGRWNIEVYDGVRYCAVTLR